MSKFVAGLAALLLTSVALPASAQISPTTAAATPVPDPALAALLDDYEAFLKANDPISAGFEGDQAAKSKLPDLSRTAELARKAPLEAFLARAEAIPTTGLSSEDRLNRDFLAWVLKRSIEAIQFDDRRLAFDSEGGVGQTAAYVASGTRITTRADADAWIARLEGFAKLYDDGLANARRGLETGFTQPKSVVESVLVTLGNEVAYTAETEPLMKPFATLPATIPAEDQAAYRTRAAAIVADRIVPRRQAWLAFVRDDYLPASTDVVGIGSRPGGKAYYAFQARSYTTTDLTPDQIHQIGLDEVARIRARMDVEMRAAGWTGDFAGFLAHLRTDPSFYATSREDMIEKASEMAKRADGGLPALFRTLPRLTYNVRPVPLDIEATYTTGRYNGGSLAEGVPGGYIVNTGKLDQRPLYELPALTLHEAVPGHHLQIALQQEAAAGPYFRRNVDVTAFTEGWGLYSEFLGEEMGFYRTPEERFGRLSYEMWRACRLVADTGMHWMGWSVERARACFTANSALAPHNIETELQRYIGWPGQALAYKIGEIRLRAIRTRAEGALGDRFNVRDFHDALLVDGPLPLDLLDARMDAWITAQSAK
ncbi:hypothetical protein KOAAANKH_01564 [Brevundimonas sp. NIBR10]|uniref:DUF885 domain-containing protein n=1 Tax=Brevundimonas sp. NIBR10 TaxID=3015997 RepID=UPI0022F1B1F0|nr:DUF885 family protein [Brevundimonas sp. NIBR10]WGM46691.1 hypothetical protein KOAAANKH_01564 [Brevundimonas sp. NIBR10]